MPTAKVSLSTEVQYVKGVGPMRAELLASRGVRTVEDLLYYTPFRYEDRTRVTPIRDLVPGQTATILGRVLTCGLMRTRGGMYIYELSAVDASGAGENGSRESGVGSREELPSPISSRPPTPDSRLPAAATRSVASGSTPPISRRARFSVRGNASSSMGRRSATHTASATSRSSSRNMRSWPKRRRLTRPRSK